MLAEIAWQNLAKLAKNPYPGRVIVIGRLSDEIMIQLYAIMGRSENSRNRRFVQDGNIVRTEAIDPAKVEDPSLIIYNAMREWCGDIFGDSFIVSNGHQTDTIYDNLAQNAYSFPASQMEWSFEPDEPNYTPRISAMTRMDGTAMISTLTRGPDGECQRTLYEYDAIPAGYGYCVHTYAGDGNPLPSFLERPYLIPLVRTSLEGIAEQFWHTLNAENRVALVAKQINTNAGADEEMTTVHIINR